MSRFALDPPDENAHIPRVHCATRGCDEYVDVPEREVFCYFCRCEALRRQADQIESTTAGRVASPARSPR